MTKEAVRFTNYYVSHPVCSVSRASLLTGSYSNRIGIHGALLPQSKNGINAQEVTLAELFKSKGDTTALFEKWHLGSQPKYHPLRHGFDHFYGIPHSNDMYPNHLESPDACPDLPLYEGEKIIG